MPLYYFHLSFGDRTVPDEEGVDLPDRAAAREEARAVVRDLSDHGGGRRWASWFLNVTDDQGSFLRLPIGYPALEVLPKDGPRPTRFAAEFELPDLLPPLEVAPEELQPEEPRTNRAAALICQRRALRKETAELLERNYRMREELFSQVSLSEQIRARTHQLLASARVVGWFDDGRSVGAADARQRRSARPRLVLLRGGAGT